MDSKITVEEKDKFLYEERVEIPDVDIDLTKTDHQWVIEYLKKKYGDDQSETNKY